MLIAYLERIRPEKNERRFYAVYWTDTLLGPAVMRVHGRKGAWGRVLPPVFFPDLETARPYMERLVRRKLRSGYRLLSFNAPAISHRARGLQRTSWMDF